MTALARDHLFISYAWDDRAFVDWLALKLAALGYSVWYDRLHLLGGEPFPTEIDNAIKNRSFRVLGVLSRSSIARPNPTKERTLALSLARERSEDFLIPLNVDNLKASELDWMTSDLTFISFSPNWAEGLRSLAKKLEAIHAPRVAPQEAAGVQSWLRAQDRVENKPEVLWANLLAFSKVPTGLFAIDEPAAENAGLNSSVTVASDGRIWTFERPKSPPRGSMSTHGWLLDGTPIPIRNIGTRLLREVVEAHAVRLGLARHPESRLLYFPANVVPKDQIGFSDPNGRKRRVAVRGYRRIRLRGMEAKAYYALAPRFSVNHNLLDVPAIELGLHLSWFDEHGNPLDPARAFRLTKKVRGGWWNDKALARFRALAGWLSQGETEFSPCGIPSAVLSGQLTEFSSSVGFTEESKSDKQTENVDLEDGDDLEPVDFDDDIELVAGEEDVS